MLAECIDGSAEMAAQEMLQDREALLRRLIEEMPDGLLQLDVRGELVYANKRLLEVLGLPGDPSATAPAKLLGRFGPAEQERVRAALRTALRDGRPEDLELETVAIEGAARFVLVKVRPLLREDASVAGMIASVQDVTGTACARRELERRASTDGLTGAENRNAIIDALAAAIDAPDPVGVVYLDLDRFKQINDTLGHAAGDELAGTTFELSASIGVAFLADRRLSAEQLIERADDAMYGSKRERRGRPVVATV